MKNLFSMFRKWWMNWRYGPMLRRIREQESATAMPLPVREPVPMSFAPLANKTVVRDTRRRRGLSAFGTDSILLRDDFAAERAAHTLNTAKRNHGQWHRWHG